MTDNAQTTPIRGFEPPLSISQRARELLAMPPLSFSIPDMDDPAAWRRHVAEHDAQIAVFYDVRAPADLVSRRDTIAGVPCYEVVPGSVDPRRAVLEIHGGALFYGGGELVEKGAIRVALRAEALVISPDYRMPPDHPYPAAVDDCVAVYRALIDRFGAANLVVSGVSAGGNLAAALVLRARDEGLPLPGGLVLLTPEIDLTESGDTFQTLLGLDRIPSFMALNRRYAAGVPLDHPYVSPLFGDFSGGFPRTFLQSGTRDLYLSNAVRMHRALCKAGVQTEMHIWEAMPHGGFGDAPEDEELALEVRRFVQSCFAG